MRHADPWVPPVAPTSSRDLQALGVSRDKLSGEVRRENLVQLRRGVYIAASAVPEDPRELHLLHARAEQVADPRLVASHTTAALEWRLPLPSEADAIELAPVLSAARRDTVRSAATRTARIHVTDLPGHHVVIGESGLRVTSLARTAVDVAAGELPQLLVVLDAAVRAECLQIPSARRRSALTVPRIQAAGRAPLIEAATTTRRYTGVLRSAIGLADPRRETPIESLSAGHMLLAELPQPIPQAHIGTVIGSVYPDFLWPDHRAIGEADGAVKYQTPEAMLQEKRREQVLRDRGFAIVRWTGREIHLTPGRVLDRIARALGA